MLLPLTQRINIAVGFLVGGIIASRSLFFFVAVGLTIYWFIFERPKLIKIKKMNIKAKLALAEAVMKEKQAQNKDEKPLNSSFDDQDDTEALDPLHELTASTYEDATDHFESDTEADDPHEVSTVGAVVDLALTSLKAPNAIFRKIKNFRHSSDDTTT